MPIKLLTIPCVGMNHVSNTNWLDYIHKHARFDCVLSFKLNSLSKQSRNEIQENSENVSDLESDSWWNISNYPQINPWKCSRKVIEVEDSETWSLNIFILKPWIQQKPQKIRASKSKLNSSSI